MLKDFFNKATSMFTYMWLLINVLDLNEIGQWGIILGHFNGIITS